MTDDRNKKDSSTAEVSVNWEGLKRFLGWEGSITELKRIQLDRPDISSKKHSQADD